MIPLRLPGEQFIQQGQAKTAEGKEPYTPDWQTVHAQRESVQESTEATFHDMSALLGQGRNIGCVIPDGVVVLDWDTKQLQNIRPSDVDKIRQAVLDTFPDAPAQLTQSGGLHLWFKVNPGEQFTATTGVEVKGYKFDVRSGGRSQVVVYPSKGAKGAYQWLRNLPPDLSMLPLRPSILIDISSSASGPSVAPAPRTNYGPMPGMVQRPPKALYSRLEGIDPVLYHKIAAGLPIGEPGDRNNALTRAVGVILGTWTALDKPPHPEIPFQILYHSVANDKTVGGDGGLPPTLAELWSICCRLTDSERPKWQGKRDIYAGLQAIQQRQLEDKKEEALPALEATAKKMQVAVEQLESQVVLLDVGGNFWVLDPEIKGYHGPLKPQALLRYIDKFAGVLIPPDGLYTPARKMKQVQEIIRDFGQQVKRIWFDSHVDVPTYNPRDGALVRPAWKRRELTPCFNLYIDQWLQALAGENYETLLDWLASLPLVGYPTAALYLHGPTGVGKTLFIEGLAKLWVDPPVPFRHAVADFNSALLGSPLVFVEEGLGSDTDSLRFRDLLTAEVHDVRIKFEAPGELRGHVRMIVAANNPNALRIKDNLTHSDREAISRRILWLDGSVDAVHYLTGIGGRRITADWVGGFGLARHVLAVSAERAGGVYERMDRLLVPGNQSSSKTRMLLTHRVPRAILKLIITELARVAWAKTPVTSDLLRYRDDSVEVRWQDLENIWRMKEGLLGKLPTGEYGEKELGSIAVQETIKMVGEVPTKFFLIDRGVLLEEAAELLDVGSSRDIKKFLEKACAMQARDINSN